MCGKVFLTGIVEEGADVMMTKHLISLLKSRTGFKIIYPGDAWMLSNGFNGGNENTPSEVKKNTLKKDDYWDRYHHNRTHIPFQRASRNNIFG